MLAYSVTCQRNLLMGGEWNWQGPVAAISEGHKYFLAAANAADPPRDAVVYHVGDCVELADGKLGVVLAFWEQPGSAMMAEVRSFYHEQEALALTKTRKTTLRSVTTPSSAKVVRPLVLRSSHRSHRGSQAILLRCTFPICQVVESDCIAEVAVNTFVRQIVVTGDDDSATDAEFVAMGMLSTKTHCIAPFGVHETRLQRSRALGHRVLAVPSEGEEIGKSEVRQLVRSGVKRSRKVVEQAESGGDGDDSDQRRKRSPAVTAVIQKLQRACEELQLSSLPRVMTGREDERDEIYTALRSSIEQQSAGGPIYISGLPGAGKTSIVKEIIRTLETQRDANELRGFAWVEVNGLQMPRPDVAYSVLWKALHPPAKVEEEDDEGEDEDEADRISRAKAKRKVKPPPRVNMSAARLCENLQREFHAKNAARPMLLVLLDEMDFMLAGKNQVLYNLLEWQTAATAKLVLVGIANTMDLPERLPTKIRSRLGGHRITFPAYTRFQLESIIQQRLRLLDVFSDEAIQLCAKSLAHQSGDVRQALSLCRKAAEVCLRRLGGGSKVEGEYFVTGQDLHHAQQAVSVSAPMSRLRACSKFECIFLIALRMEVRSNGARGASKSAGELEAVIERFAILCKTHSFVPIPRLRGLLCICDELERSGIIRQIASRTSRYPLLELRCSHQEMQDVFLSHPVGMQLIT
ncbi:hypothetical protein BBJ28_00011060 [Nothophytophthora sp. Chile5]|nr:hypothetical protein BBJ28_00011060 [Nothophytophthora sp. Chile5]